MCLIPTYAAKTLLFLAVLGLSFSQVVATGAVGRETTIVDYGASAAFLIPRTLVRVLPSSRSFDSYVRSVRLLR